MLKQKSLLQEHTSKTTTEVTRNRHPIHKYFSYNRSGMDPPQKALSPPVVGMAFLSPTGSLLIKRMFPSSKVLSEEQTFSIEELH